jgi:hypothetical protein
MSAVAFPEHMLHCERAAYFSVRAALLSCLALPATPAPLLLVAEQLLWLLALHAGYATAGRALPAVVEQSRRDQARAILALPLFLLVLATWAPRAVAAALLLGVLGRVLPARLLLALPLFWPALRPVYEALLLLLWLYALFLPRTPLSFLVFALHAAELTLARR